MTTLRPLPKHEEYIRFLNYAGVGVDGDTRRATEAELNEKRHGCGLGKCAAQVLPSPSRVRTGTPAPIFVRSSSCESSMGQPVVTAPIFCADCGEELPAKRINGMLRLRGKLPPFPRCIACQAKVDLPAEASENALVVRGEMDSEWGKTDAPDVVGI